MRLEVDVQPLASSLDGVGAQNLEKRSADSSTLVCGVDNGVEDEGAKEGRNTWYRLAEPELAPALDDLLRLVLTVDPSCCTGAERTCA